MVEKSGMERLIEFHHHLVSAGFDLSEVSFQQGISLQLDVERLIQERIDEIKAEKQAKFEALVDKSPQSEKGAAFLKEIDEL